MYWSLDAWVDSKSGMNIIAIKRNGKPYLIYKYKENSPESTAIKKFCENNKLPFDMRNYNDLFENMVGTFPYGSDPEKTDDKFMTEEKVKLQQWFRSFILGIVDYKDI